MERKYRMTKMPDGDWMFVANDGATLCRVSWYREDGSADDGHGGHIIGRFWNAHIFRGTLAEANALAHSDEEAFADRWNYRYWHDVSTMRPTRAAAIESALQAAERRSGVQRR